jgi:hypothetical protein
VDFLRSVSRRKPLPDLLHVTAPLVIRLPSGEKRLMAERFAHPRGLLYFEPFWRDNRQPPAIHLAEGPIKGEGPWKVGDAVVTILSCADSELNMEWNMWQQQLMEADNIYADEEATRELARRQGAHV